MSSGQACKDNDHRPYWVVVQRNYNQSAFSGYKKTHSEYSLVRCQVGGCRSAWRTKAAYVSDLPDAPPAFS